MHYTAIFFDFDGTLVDSYAAITASVNRVRATHQLPPLTVADVHQHVGRGPDYLLRNTVPGGDLAKDLATYRAHHPTVMVKLTSLLNGAAELLAKLKQAGFAIGLCSNKPRMYSQVLLDRLDIARYFDVVLGPEDVSNIKPAPDMLLAGLKRLNVEPAQALYVGDMTVDIETARGAGVAVWVVPTGSDVRATLEAAKPDRIVEHLDEIGTALMAGVGASAAG